MDHLTSGGKLDSPATQRVFRAIMEGVITTPQTAAVSLRLRISTQSPVAAWHAPARC